MSASISSLDVKNGTLSARKYAMTMAAQKKAEEKRQVQLSRAREYTEDFLEYAIRHEKTGKRIENTWFHKEWQKLVRENSYVVLIAPVEHAKTSQIAVGKALHLIGRNPESRGAIISNTATQAQKILNSIRTHIESNDSVKEVFPHLKPSPRMGDSWGKEAITVERKTIAKDPTVQACGVYGPIVGSRLDWVIMDDVLDFENTRTADQMQKLVDWFDTTLWTRLTSEAQVMEDGSVEEKGAPCWVIGTPWDDDDLLHVLSRRPGWVARTYSAVENPEDSPEEWKPIWLSKKRLIHTYRNTQPHNFARKYFCQIKSKESSRFQKDWISRCVAVGMRRKLLDRAPASPGGRLYPCFTGVDLGIGQGEKHDMTVFFTIALIERNRRLVVDVQAGRWQGDEIVSRLFDIKKRYNSICRVESVAAQRFLLQWANHEGAGVVPFNTTGKNKWDEAFGVESIAVEMRAGMWIIPSGDSGTTETCDDEVKQWIHEMIHYKPQGHTGDRLMASWFARETLREFSAPMQQSMDTISR